MITIIMIIIITIWQCFKIVDTPLKIKDEEIIEGYNLQLKRNVAAGVIDKQESERILQKVKNFFNEYPYLVRKNSLEIIE